MYMLEELFLGLQGADSLPPFAPFEDGRCATLPGFTVPTALSTTLIMLDTKSSPPDPMALNVRSVG